MVVIIPFEDEADAIAHRQRLRVRPCGWRLVPRCRACARRRGQAAHRPRPDQRRAARQARHAWRLQAVGRRPRVGPLRHRGIPRIQVDHGLRTIAVLQSEDHHEQTFLSPIGRRHAGIARERRVRASRRASHPRRGSAAGRQLERLRDARARAVPDDAASARPSSSTTRPAATASSARWTWSSPRPTATRCCSARCRRWPPTWRFVKNLPYDPRRDLTPIAGVSVTNWVLMVKASSPVRTLRGVRGAMRSSGPASVSIGYSTTTVQVQIATLNKMAGIELLAVPYKGTPATITDVLGGSLDATLADPGNALAQVKGGQIARARRSARSSAIPSRRTGRRSPRRFPASTSPRGTPDGASRHVARPGDQDQCRDECRR